MSRDARRILDASANRAREALRVLEDCARFTLDDHSLTMRCKAVRHELREVLAAMPGGELRAMAHRDTAGDVGTTVTTPGERSRRGMGDVVIAAGKRLTESLRSIEEIVKTIAPALSSRVEALRYRAYDIDRDMSLAMGSSRAGFAGWRCCVLLAESLCRRSWRDVAEGAIIGGADCIQLREKDLFDGALLKRARDLVELARGRAAVVINDRPEIALLSGAAGVHLGQNDMSVTDARRVCGGDLLVGVSTATIEQAREALVGGADYCGVGPMFSSTTKPKDHLAGPAYLREYLSHEPALPPALAISAITPGSIPALNEAAAGRPFGVAVSKAVCAADDPKHTVQAILHALRSRAGSPPAP